MKVEIDLLKNYKECKKVFKNNKPILEKSALLSLAERKYL